MPEATQGAAKPARKKNAHYDVYRLLNVTPIVGVDEAWEPVSFQKRTSTARSWLSARARQRCSPARRGPLWPTIGARHDPCTVVAAVGRRLPRAGRRELTFQGGKLEPAAADQEGGRDAPTPAPPKPSPPTAPAFTKPKLNFAERNALENTIERVQKALTGNEAAIRVRAHYAIDLAVWWAEGNAKPSVDKALDWLVAKVNALKV